MAFWKRKSPPPSSAPPAAPPAGNQGGEAEDPGTEFLIGNTLEDRAQVQILLDAIAKVSESRDLESLLEFVVDSSIEVTGAERGFLVLLDENGEQSVRVVRTQEGVPLEDSKYSRSVVKRVLDHDEPMRTVLQSDAEALELGASVFDLKLRAVMCVPLAPPGEAAETIGGSGKGALYVDSKAATRKFKDPDLSLFHALARQIAIALENARLNIQSLEKAKLEQSLEIASEIQSGLMPGSQPELSGWDAFGWYRPAEHAAGDFYDFVKTRDGRLAVFVGDVTGHGIGPALITATAQASLRSYAKVLPDSGQVVTMLNQDLAERIDPGMFLTLFAAFISSEGRVETINAGQTPPLLWRGADKTIEELKGGGPALGMMEEFDYVVGYELELVPGDALIMFTDGLVEARHPSHPDRLFGDDGMRAVIRETAPQGSSSREMTEEIVRNVLEFCGGEREDDMTLVVVLRTDPDAGGH